MSESPRGGTLVAALAVGLCCALPILLASGALATIGGTVARAWPLVLLGGLVLGYAVTRWLGRARSVRSRMKTL